MEAKTDHHEHEEAIAPVRPPFGAAAGGSSPAGLEDWGGLWPPGPLVMGIAAAVLLAAVVGVFTVLPRLVGQNAREGAPAQSAPPSAAPQKPASPELTEQQRAELADRTESVLAELLTQQQRLKEMSVESWGGEEWTRYSQQSKQGDDAYLAKSYQEAIAAYGKALDTGKSLLSRSSEITSRALDAGQQALAVGNAGLAKQQFDLVLGVEPGNAAAKAGRARAEKLPRVLDLVRQGDELRKGDQLEEAAKAYADAVALDGEWKPAAAALADLRREIADREFETLMSKGFAALSAKDYAGAQRQFKAALGMRPKSTEARDGLVQARQGRTLDEIALARARALAFERRELWDRAIEQYESALAEDDSLDFAKTGLERARERAALDAKLTNLIKNPSLLFGDDVLAGARDLLEQARAIADPGDRLQGQVGRLEALITAATTPVSVELKSDAQTEVTVYRVGHLGTFSDKQVQLRPGRYTAVGSRDGYRDVRKTFTVLPGRESEPVSVICFEPI